jgi:MFS family permease
MAAVDTAPAAAGGALGGRASVRRLAIARATSASGTQAARIGLVYVIYERTNSAGWVSALLLADLGMGGVLGPVAGWIGDHLERRRVMVVSELAAGLVYALAMLADAPWVLVAVTLLATVVNSPFLPASTAAIPNLTDEGDLRWANSMMALSTNGALMAGPIVGGWLVAARGIHLVFLVNAVTFGASAVLIAGVKGRFHAERDPAHRPSGGLRVGYQLIARHPVVRTVTVALALTHFTFGLAMVADPALADQFHAGSVGYAVLYTGWGAVAVVGAWLSGRRFPQHAVPYGIVGGLAMVAVACGLIATLPAFWAIVAIGSLGGLGSGALFPLTTGLLQEHTPDEVRARVFGASDTIDRSLFAVGMLAGAPLVESVGAQGSYGVTAVIIGVSVLIMAGLPRAVRRSRPAPDVAVATA